MARQRRAMAGEQLILVRSRHRRTTPAPSPGASKAPRRWYPTEEIGWSRTQEIRWYPIEEIGWVQSGEILQARAPPSGSTRPKRLVRDPENARDPEDRQ